MFDENDYMDIVSAGIRAQMEHPGSAHADKTGEAKAVVAWNIAEEMNLERQARHEAQKAQSYVLNSSKTTAASNGLVVLWQDQ